METIFHITVHSLKKRKSVSDFQRERERAMATCLVLSKLQLQPGHWDIIIPIVQGYITNTLTRKSEKRFLLIAIGLENLSDQQLSPSETIGQVHYLFEATNWGAG